MRKLIIFGALMITVLVFTHAQKPATLKQSAEKAIEREDFASAIDYYRNYLELTGNRSDVALNLAQAYYYRGLFVEAAEELFYIREQSDQFPSEVLWWEARVLHAQNQFSLAAEQYKAYWKFVPEPERREVERALLDCQAGQSILAEGKRAFVHNMSNSVNSVHDELAPIFFTFKEQNGLVYSVRHSLEDQKLTGFTSYFLAHMAEKPVPLNLSSNAGGLIYTIDPSQNDALVYAGNRWPYGRIERLSMTDSEGISRDSSSPFLGPAKGKYGDTDLFWVSDSCVLFAAQMKSGKGGYDIYKSCLRSNGWTVAEPVPGLVNTPWHERSPSLHPNGKILFLSSDRPGGLGAFDVYYSEWNGRRWGEPQNLGVGVNSIADELFFRWGGDGHTAYLSSNRPGSYGKFDIYQSYFKDAFAEEVNSDPETAQLQSNTGHREDAETLIKKSLFFKDLDVSISTDQQDQLLDLAAYAESSPSTDIHIICRSRYKGPKKYDLFFCLQKAREVGEELNALGVAPQRIHLSGAGAGNSEVATSDSKDSQYKVDFILSDVDQYIGEQTTLSSSAFNKRLHQSDFFYLAPDSLFPGLTYSVQVAAFQRIFEGEVLEDYQWPMVKTRLDKDVNYYTVGIFTRYQAAKNLRKRLLAAGHKGAFIVAKIDGIRKTRGQLHPLKHKFQDLTSYIYVD